MAILQTRIFKADAKRLHPNQKSLLDEAVKLIALNPEIGEGKVGDLAGVRVHKFKMINQEVLLAYQWMETENQLILLALGHHENFYRDLKRQRHS
ncbi:type II toxin-antitoxin system RelE/ParE family toxin [Candidatus Magnetaquicoccus inordinatus]|uniref:type II toxin-antitoxin system RelE/ParE family toxin n=1 Tax=Candidatus Magnetaquicoccus inordinatus TaxID=2496818 RepID=UPI00102BACE9|nr:type II toxin-antitoxin system RelE/ParE family toxin [Candidatus Magnetaquicoccus inordinatus]